MARLESLKHFIEPVMFFTFMTMMMEVSLVQQLIRRKVCLIEKMPDCYGKASTELVNASSPWIGSYTIVLSLVTLVTGLWFGSWADKYGRKKMMVAPSIGSILSTANFIASSYFITTTPLSLMASALIIGLSTGTLGVSSTCFGLVSEVTSPERRSARIALMEAMIFTGGAFGFYIVGYFLRRTSFIALFSFELLIHCGVLIYILKVIQEPERSRQTELSTTSVMSLQHIVSMCRTVTRPREQNFRAAVVLLIVSSLMLSFGLAASGQLTFTLLTSPPLSWSGTQYSSYHGLMVAIQGSALVVLLPVCLRLFKMKDATLGCVGIASRMLGLAGLAASTTSWIAYTSLAFFSLSEFALPSVRSILSKVVGPNEKSQIFAFMSAQQSLAFAVTSTILLIPGFMTATFPGLGMAIASAMQTVPLAIMLYLYFALDVNTLLTPTCVGDQSENYESTEDSITVSQRVDAVVSVDTVTP